MSALSEPLQFAFFQNALLAAVLVGAACGLMSVFTVLRGMSYIGHGLAHVAFGGAVVGALLSVNFYAAAVAATFLAAALIQRMSGGGRIRPDAAIGIVTTAVFAAGVLLISTGQRFERSFEAALFGSILGVTGLDLAVIGAISLVLFAVVFLNHRRILFAVFDEGAASAFGVPARQLSFLITILLALTVVASTNIVGVTMIAAALVMPAATVRMLTDDYSRMILGSPMVGAATGAAGMFASYHLDTASGATVVIVGAVLFGAAWTWRSISDRFAYHAHAHRHGPIVHAHPHDHAGEHAHTHEDAVAPRLDLAHDHHDHGRMPAGLHDRR